jgi:hypothetical protein
MSPLTDQVDRLLSAHRRAGSPVPLYLRAASSADEVEARLRSAGFDPPRELVEFFTLQDGVDGGRWYVEHPQAHDLFLYPFYRSPSLDEAIGLHQTRRGVSVDLFGSRLRRLAEFPMCGYWAETWLPVFAGEYSLVVDCRGGGAGWIFGQDSHPGDSTMPLYPTLTDLIQDVARRFEAGTLRWREDWLGFDDDEAASMQLDRDLQARNAGVDPHGLY